MKRTLTIGVATAALLLAGAGVALAQDETGPDTAACTTAETAVVTATAERDAAKVPSDLEQQAANRQAELDAGTAQLAEIQADLDENRALLASAVESAKPYFQAQVNSLTATLATATAAQAALTAARDEAATELADAQAALVAAEKALDDAEAARDTACTPPVVVPVDEFDCDDFPVRADAQAKLDETPGSDPHRLDADGDRVACELELPASNTPPPAPGVVPGYSQVQVVPQGGVATGA